MALPDDWAYAGLLSFLAAVFFGIGFLLETYGGPLSSLRMFPMMIALFCLIGFAYFALVSAFNSVKEIFLGKSSGGKS